MSRRDVSGRWVGRRRGGGRRPGTRRREEEGGDAPIGSRRTGAPVPL